MDNNVGASYKKVDWKLQIIETLVAKKLGNVFGILYFKYQIPAVRMYL